VFIDEVQRVPPLLDAVQSEVESTPPPVSGSPVRFECPQVATGSTPIFLPGRVLIEYLHPLAGL